ncbi:spore germination protein GerPC [Gracilibacillus dipsosauri]|uniref:Spore gernimation protein GerPC n=1 Tax=Gracilibacillus dipsosauri TaxID=178340 RepID=A0A317KYZ0_9BACI|nr:spore germination protein GerPC [Gracilibacillus dipsosauri]PWU67758.1 spore gernimation protein GerPC [Gracilibacillus dipsosauri]
MEYQQMYFYIQQLEQQIHYLQNEVTSLTNRLQQLEGQTNQKTTIEKLEYHFDQLKIERLDGTLHIGVTPEELKQADDLSLPIKQANPSPVHQNLYQYIDQDLPSYIEQLEREHQYPLEEDYRQLLLEDVKKQLPQRISFYEQQQNPASTQYVYSQVKDELMRGLKKWFDQQTKKE